jgi:hypothetical protein
MRAHFIRARQRWLALIVLAIAAGAAANAATSTRSPSPQAIRELATFKKCGSERWKVKTLQDRPDLLAPQTKTIAYLVSRTKPDPLPATRAPFERHHFIVTAAVTEKLSEDDGDFHLVLDDGLGHTMIAEAPNALCDQDATAFRRDQMAEARAAVRVCARAEIRGVAFFDFFHNQTGVAPNEIELHPVLGFRCMRA